MARPFSLHGPLAPAPNLFNDNGDAMVLSASTADSYTVGAGITLLFFNATTDFWASTAGTAVVPTGNVTNGSAAKLNPVMRQVKAGDVISFISESDCIISIEKFGKLN
jgi:hypothetical protein